MEKLGKLVGEAVFPAACLSCRKTSDLDKSPWLCRSCTTGLRPRFQTFCHVCGKERGLSPTKNCAHDPAALRSVTALFLYNDTAVRRLIHALKYYFILDTLKIWQDAILKERANLLRLDADVLIPLPLHKRRLRERGFNQAELIAGLVASVLNKPIFKNALLKTRQTKAQMKIKNPRARARNIKGVFRVEDLEPIEGKNILLVDDVVTTGSTLEEAARILREAGAKEICAFVLARD